MESSWRNRHCVGRLCPVRHRCRRMSSLFVVAVAGGSGVTRGHNGDSLFAVVSVVLRLLPVLASAVFIAVVAVGMMAKHHLSRKGVAVLGGNTVTADAAVNSGEGGKTAAGCGR